MNLDLTRYKCDRDLLVRELVNFKPGLVFKGNGCCCPFHKDSHESAGIFQSSDGWRFKCQKDTCQFTGDIFEVRARINATTSEQEIIKERDRFGMSPHQTKQEKPTFATQAEAEKSKYLAGYCAKYRYSDRYYIYRINQTGGGKRFCPLYRQDDGRWIPAKQGGVQPIYTTSGLNTKKIALFVEGEKCVDILASTGVPAFTTPGGAAASKSDQFDFSALTGLDVYLWPDNDSGGDGVAHAQRVAKKLEGIAASTSIIDIAPLGLPLKGDVEQFLAGINGGARDKARAVWEVMKSAKVTGPRAELLGAVDAIERGERKSYFMPWTLLQDFARFATPTQVSVLIGEPAAGKSFFLIECAINWYEHKIPFAFYALEDEREFHMRRALAQWANEPRITDVEWVQANAQCVRQIISDNSHFVDTIGRSIMGETSEGLTKEKLQEWAIERVKAGAKIIVVDPITMKKRKEKDVWTDDEMFMDSMKAIARDSKVSIILASHPKDDIGGHGDVRLGNIAGAKAVGRFAQKVIWLQHHINPVETPVKNSMATLPMTYNRTMHILKTRERGGTGIKIAMNFGADLKFYERGIVVAKGSEQKRGAVSSFEERAIANSGVKKSLQKPIEETYDESSDELF